MNSSAAMKSIGIMRISERNQWRILLLITLVMASLMVIIPIEVPPFTANITGSLIGFLMAIGFSEMTSLENEERKVRNLKQKLDTELKSIIEDHENLEALAYRQECQVWESAKYSGLVRSMNENGLEYFASKYHIINILNQLTGNVWSVSVSGNDETSGIFEDHLMRWTNLFTLYSSYQEIF